MRAAAFTLPMYHSAIIVSNGQIAGFFAGGGIPDPRPRLPLYTQVELLQRRPIDDSKPAEWRVREIRHERRGAVGGDEFVPVASPTFADLGVVFSYRRLQAGGWRTLWYR